MHTGSEVGNLGPKTSGSSWITMSDELIVRFATRWHPSLVSFSS